MKKGYFYMFDAFLALSVIIMGLIFVFSFHSQKPYQVSGIFISSDLMDFLSDNSIFEINNQYARDLEESGLINNTKNSLLEQISIFFLTEQEDVAAKFARNVTMGAIPGKYGCELLVYNRSVSHNVSLQPGRVLQNESRMLVVSKNIVIGLRDKTTSWNPMVAEVRLWQ